MYKSSILKGLRTVGAFIIYKDTLAFMIGPDNLEEKLGIVRIGGHIEENEDLFQCLKREIEEEATIEVKLLSSPYTYYKTSWDDNNYSEVSKETDLEIKPLVIVGDEKRSTAVFLAVAEKEPKPSSEAQGIIFLKEEDIKKICKGNYSLRDFLNGGGKLIQQKHMDYDMEMYAGVHLSFLNILLQEDNELLLNLFKKPVHL
jgi:ADP-ribose pyrophosphatase YjhB (NUDIX family)